MTDDVYAWRDLRFTLPAGLDDETLLAFRGAGWSLTVARDPLGGATLEAYARTQEQAFAQQRFASYTAEGPKPLEGAPKDAKGALLVDRRFVDQAGAKVFQRQCFLALKGANVVAIVTATAREAGFEQAKQAALAVVQSMHLGSR